MSAYNTTSTIQPIAAAARTASTVIAGVVPVGITLFIYSVTYAWFGITPAANTLMDLEIGTSTATVANAAPAGWAVLDSFTMPDFANGYLVVPFERPLVVPAGLFPGAATFNGTAGTTGRIDVQFHGALL